MPLHNEVYFGRVTRVCYYQVESEVSGVSFTDLFSKNHLSTLELPFAPDLSAPLRIQLFSQPTKLSFLVGLQKKN